MQAPDYKTLYDFSVIETAVETLVAASNPDLSWIGPDAAAQFQKERPRVECYLEPGSPFGSPPHYINTADGNRRVNGWSGQLRTMIITATLSGVDEADGAANSYKLHSQYRAFVLEFFSTLGCQLVDNATLLPYHTIGRIWEAGNSPKISPQTGVYTSQLNHGITYAIRPTAYPGGITNA